MIFFVGPGQESVCFFVFNKLFRFAIEEQCSFQARCNISKVAGCGSVVSDFDICLRPSAIADAIEEIVVVDNRVLCVGAVCFHFL